MSVTDEYPFSEASAVYSAAYRLMEKYAAKEYQAQLAQHTKAGRSKKTFRFVPSEDHRNLIDALNRGDEESIKGHMMLIRVYNGL